MGLRTEVHYVLGQGDDLRPDLVQQSGDRLALVSHRVMAWVQRVHAQLIDRDVLDRHPHDLPRVVAT